MLEDPPHQSMDVEFILSGRFEGPVATGGGEAVDFRGALNPQYKPTFITYQKNIPRIPPEVPRLHTLIGREAEKKALLELYHTVATSKHGKTVFLLGKTGSGRHALVEWLQEQVFEQGGVVAATRFWDSRLLRKDETARLYLETPVMQRYGQALETAFAHTSAAFPHQEAWLNLIAQLTAQTSSQTAIHPDWPDSPLTLARFVRRAASERPLLLTVEYLDWADALWIDLLRRLADEIAQDLPVLLVITLDAPAPLERLRDDQHSESTRLAVTLMEAKLAQAYYLGMVTSEEIAAHLEPIAPALVERLHTLASGDPQIVEMLWDEWVRQRAVMRGWDGSWDINHQQAGNWWAFGDTWDHARMLLERRLELTSSELTGIFDLGTAQTLLACAALEGETFTAAAVAETLGFDPDDVIDFFDTCLCCPVDTDTDDPSTLHDALLVDVGFAEVPNGNTLCRYRFARPYLWHVFGKYPQASQERQVWSKSLAETLEAWYAPDTYRIADALYRLFDIAGCDDRARVYLRQPLTHPNLDELRFHVRWLQETTNDDDNFSTYRLFEKGFALLDRLVHEAPDLWDEGAALAQDLAQRAAQVSDRDFEADAYCYHARCLEIGGQFAEALPQAQRAVRIYQELHGENSHYVAQGSNVLGCVLRDLGKFPAARVAFERALRIAEATYGPEHPRVIGYVNNLGNVLHDLGNLSAARAAFERVLRIGETAFGPQHPTIAVFVHNLGLVLHDLGDFSEARDAFERALRIDEATFGSEHPSVARHVNSLGLVLRDLGDLPAARVAHERALRIDEASYGSEHPLVARDLDSLGLVLHDLGDLPEAHAAHERALRINEAICEPGHPIIALNVNNLGSVLRSLGNLHAARIAFERALLIAEATYGPEHREIVIYVHNLALALYDLGELPAARDAFERALRIAEATYGPEHPRVIGYVNNLGNVLHDLGNLSAARAAFKRAVAICEKAFGRRHLATADALCWLGILERGSGNLEQARAYMEEALHIFECFLPPEHPNICAARRVLGSLEIVEKSLDKEDHIMTTFDHGYALLIGVDGNSILKWALPDVANDIAALQAVLHHPERCAYPEEHIKTLTGEASTRQGILDGLDWLAERLQADTDATAVIYYTGHGWCDTVQTPAEFYLIPYDIRETGIRTRALRAVDFAAAIAGMQPRRLLVLLDCCHAGGMGVKEVTEMPEGYVSTAPPPTLFMQGEAGGVAPGTKGLESLAQGRGRAVLSASTGEQSSYIRKDRRMSIFTYHLIEALTGHAQPQAGASEVLVSDVMSYVYRQVPPSARADWDKEQIPDYQVSGNFPVALLLGGKGLAKGEPAPAPETLDAAPVQPTRATMIFDQRGQTVGTQTNIAGDVHGPVLSGSFDGPVAVGGGEAVDLRQSRGAVYRPTGPVKQHFGDDIRITNNGVTVDEFLELLTKLQQELGTIALNPQLSATVESDVQAVQTQAQMPEPQRGIIMAKLNGILAMLATADGVWGLAERVAPLAQRALEAAQQLFR